MVTPPPRIGRFTVQRVIGHGGMGVVYLARDPQLGRHVAIKVLPPLAGDAFADRLLNEARLAGRFVHPNVIAVYEVGEEQGYPYFVMPYVEGRTLEAMIKARETIPLSLALRWMVELCRGLSYAHGFHVVHRDIKPGNLIVDAQDVLRILDFGIAKIVATTQANFTAVGTPAYMAPEQYSGAPVDARTDVYATGLVLFELLTGLRARSGESPAQVYRQIASGAVPRLLDAAPGLDPALADICARATATDPADRFQTARELGDALSRLQTRAAYREQAEPEAPAPGLATTVPGTIQPPRAAPPGTPTPPLRAPTPTPAATPPSPVAPPLAMPGTSTPPPMPVSKPAPMPTRDPIAAPPGPASEPPPFDIRNVQPAPGQVSPSSAAPKPSRTVPAIAIGLLAGVGLLALLAVFALLPIVRSIAGPGAAPRDQGSAAAPLPSVPEPRVEPAGPAPETAPARSFEPIAVLPDTRREAATRKPPEPATSARDETAPPSPPPPVAPVRVGGTIKAPTKTRDVAPVYPSIAQSARVQGIVILEATIEPSGRVRDVKVVRSIPLLDDAAVTAVRQWEFTPTLLNGVAVPVIMTVTVNFTLTTDMPAAPAGRGTFAGDAGLLFVYITPGSEAAYERLLRRVRDALRQGARPAAMAQGWRVYRAQASPQGESLFVHVIEPPVRGADYTQLYALVHEASPDDARTLAAATKGAFARPMSLLNLTLVRAPIQRGARVDGLRGLDNQPTFTTRGGLLLVSIKPTATAAYESAMASIFGALGRHTKPERQAMAANWLVFKGDTPVKGETMYVSVIDPVVPGADYLNTYQLVTETLGSQEGYAADAGVRGALGTTLNKIEMTPLLDMSGRN